MKSREVEENLNYSVLKSASFYMLFLYYTFDPLQEFSNLSIKRSLCSRFQLNI